MKSPILQTKLFIPAAHKKTVFRKRLFDKLNSGLDKKLTLISAPAGFGKSTLLSSWVKTSNHKVSWLSIDAEDNDPTRFFPHFVASIQRNDETIGKDLANALQLSQSQSFRYILSSLINELSESSSKFILILDDFHQISSQDIHDGISFFLEYQPRNVHLIISTREDPPLTLARLRALGDLNEIRASHLRFKSPEVIEFFNQKERLDLSQKDIDALETRTEGWIAGLQLAAILLDGQADKSALIQSFTGSNRLVMDYLLEEVLNRQPEQIQTFLLQTSILNRMTGSLCNAITGQNDGQKVLERLDRANLFIVPLDNQGNWYRYHHLFADLLQNRLRQIHPEIFLDLHIKASEWFQNQGFNQEAIRHSLAGGDFQNAAELIKEIEINIIMQGESKKVIGWINALPNELVKEQPYLCILHAWALRLTGQLENAESRLIDAENAMKRMEYQDEEYKNTILGLIHFNRVYLSFMIGDHDQTIYHALQALDKLPVTETIIRAQTSLYLGLAYRYNGQLQTAIEIFNEVLSAAQSIAGASIIGVLCYLHLGYLHLEMAHLQRAKEIFDGALRFAESDTGHSELPYTGSIYVNIGYIFRQRNQLEDAYHYTAKGLSLCRDWNVADALALSSLEIAYLHQALGNDEQARSSIQEATQVFDGISQWGSKIAAAHRVKFDLEYGDIESAESWIQTNDLDIIGDFEFYREIEYLVMVRTLIALKRFDDAQTLAERIYQIAQEIVKRQTELEILILLAVVFSVKGKTEQALVHLEKALSIGQPEGYIRIFVDEGPIVEAMLKRIKTGDANLKKYVHNILLAFNDDKKSLISIDKQALIEPLSERELEILNLIASGLTNQKIADHLFLSKNTVKAHIRNIFQKLGVNGRIQALQEAKSLNILSPN